MFSDIIRKIDWDETTQSIMSKTDADVRRALAKSHCDVDDFMAMISPAASKYIEPMAQLSRKYTLERFGKTINMFIPIYITNSCTNSCIYCGFHLLAEYQSHFNSCYCSACGNYWYLLLLASIWFLHQSFNTFRPCTGHWNCGG